MSKIILVPGTNDYLPFEYTHDRWWQKHSRCSAILEANGHEVVRVERAGREIPPWGCLLNGTVFAGRNRRSWGFGSEILADRLLQLEPKDRLMIVHSHAWATALMAIYTMWELNEPVAGVVSVCSPIRRGLEEFSEVAVKHCPKIRQIFTKRDNWMQRLGSRFNKWTVPGAEPMRIPGIGHSELLRNPDKHAAEFKRGILDFLPKVAA